MVGFEKNNQATELSKSKGCLLKWREDSRETFPRNLQQSDPLNSRTPKKTWVSKNARSQLTERGPLGFGPIQFLMELCSDDSNYQRLLSQVMRICNSIFPDSLLVRKSFFWRKGFWVYFSWFLKALIYLGWWTIGGGNSNILKEFSPRSLGKMNPFWLAHIFQGGLVQNHQLVIIVYQP